ncbi:hypothetical protein AA0482_2608 [Acetobacter cibinongensis NRIC 0482]|nr:hypothetical protein AA0482_2608 [Acetobacter cibinongensis NRIC 0482]
MVARHPHRGHCACYRLKSGFLVIQKTVTGLTIMETVTKCYQMLWCVTIQQL